MMGDKENMMRNRDALYEVVAPVLKEKDTEYWLEEFRKVGFWCSRVNGYEDVENDPQVKYNNIIREIEHPKAGKIKVIATPIDFSETPCTIRMAPPVLGQHTDEILSDLGYSNEEIAAMREQGVL